MTCTSPSIRRLALIGAVLLAALTLACGSGAATTTTERPTAASSAASSAGDVADEQAAQPTALPTEAPQLAAAEPGTSRAAPLPLNTPLQFSTWAVTVTEVLQGQAAVEAIAAANQFNDPAPEGMTYLLATVELQNIGSDPEAKSALFAVDLRATGDQATLYSPAAVVTPAELEGELFPGATTSGQIAFLVPADEGNLMLRVNESLSFDTAAQRFLAVAPEATITPDPSLNDVVATEQGRTKDGPAPLGQTVTTETWEVTLLEAARGAQAAELAAAANQFNEPAPEGQEYVAVKLRARYLGDELPDSAAAIDRVSLKLVGAQGVVYEMPSVVPPSPALDATLFAGGVAEGWVVLSAAAGESGLVVIFEPPFSFASDDTRYLAVE